MREIKFRAISEVKKVMYFGYYNFDGKNHLIEIEPGKSVWVRPETVGQYTGLKDKNGVEIYEGDIVKMDSFNPGTYQVMFIDGAFCLWNDKVNYATDIHYTHHAERNQSTVIGNIYENPELIKQ